MILSHEELEKARQILSIIGLFKPLNDEIALEIIDQMELTSDDLQALEHVTELVNKVHELCQIRKYYNEQRIKNQPTRLAQLLIDAAIDFQNRKDEGKL